MDFIYNKEKNVWKRNKMHRRKLSSYTNNRKCDNNDWIIICFFIPSATFMSIFSSIFLQERVFFFSVYSVYSVQRKIIYVFFSTGSQRKLWAISKFILERHKGRFVVGYCYHDNSGVRTSVNLEPVKIWKNNNSIMHSCPALIVVVFLYILEFIMWAKKILSFQSVREHQQLENLRGNLVEVMSNVTFFI